MNSRDKGKRGEREFAAWLIQKGIDARRGQQFRGGPDSPDVVTNLPNIHIEVKRVEKLNVEKALEQSIREAAQGKVPIVAHRKNRTPWLVTLRADDFFEVVHAHRSEIPLTTDENDQSIEVEIPW